MDKIENIFTKERADSSLFSALFCGNRGVGKRSNIYNIIKRCSPKELWSKIESKQSCDILEFYGDEGIQVCKEKLQDFDTLPKELPHRWLIFNNIEYASREVNNFLLKLIEERKNFHVFITSTDKSSVCKALQLTPPVNNFSDIEKVKQFGIILYVRANYTSQTDPVTGWHKTVRFTKTKQQDLKNEIYEKFNEIGFDGKDYYFVCKKDEKNTKEWILWSGKDGKSLDRYRSKRTIAGNWEIEKQDIVKLPDEVFKGFDKTKSLKDQLNQKIDLSKIGTLKY